MAKGRKKRKAAVREGNAKPLPKNKDAPETLNSKEYFGYCLEKRKTAFSFILAIIEAMVGVVLVLVGIYFTFIVPIAELPSGIIWESPVGTIKTAHAGIFALLLGAFLLFHARKTFHK